METLLIEKAGTDRPVTATLVGYVGSGDLEVMIEPHTQSCALINIQTATSGSRARWEQVIDQVNAINPLPAMRMDIHDFSATPGVIRLRLEQAIELATEQGGQGNV